MCCRKILTLIIYCLRFKHPIFEQQYVIPQTETTWKNLTLISNCFTKQSIYELL